MLRKPIKHRMEVFAVFYAFSALLLGVEVYMDVDEIANKVAMLCND